MVPIDVPGRNIKEQLNLVRLGNRGTPRWERREHHFYIWLVMVCEIL
jgi:hypothetical protein